MKFDKYLIKDSTGKIPNKISVFDERYVRNKIILLLQDEDRPNGKIVSIVLPSHEMSKYNRNDLDDLKKLWALVEQKQLKEDNATFIEKPKMDLRDISPRLTKSINELEDIIDKIDRSNPKFPLSDMYDDVITRLFEEAYNIGYNTCFETIQKSISVQIKKRF